MNIYHNIRGHVITVLQQLVADSLLPDNLLYDAVTSEPPRDPSHGDIATNAALVVAKPAGKNPREIAVALAEKLSSFPEIETVSVAGPGFINMTLAHNIWEELLLSVLENGTGYGNSNMGNGIKTNIEYVSANPTGPLHIGHARGAVVGDVLASLLIKTGYNVTKEYYINDAGSQVDTLAKSAYLRYQEALGKDIGEIPEGLYPGDYLKIVGESFAQRHEHDYMDCPKSEWLPVIKPFALDAMMTLIKQDLLDIGITHDVFTSERHLIDHNAIENGIKILRDAGLVYQGVLEPPKGKKPENWEAKEQTIFKSTQFGDDVDRPLLRSDGSGTYFSSDVAYHQDKLNRDFNNMILILGADHGGYVKRLKAIIAALSQEKADIDIVLYQLVNFMENGQPLKMSKRAGSYITVKDVVDAVGKDVLRFIMLTRKSDALLDFDLQKVTEQSKDNPVFYVQYAHARVMSVMRNFADEMPEIAAKGIESFPKTVLQHLTHPHEIALIQLIAQWPRIVESAASLHEPHRIAFYLQDLAAAFHSLWNAGKDDESLRFLIKDDIELTQARLLLIKSCATTIASGLQVMGVEPVMEM